MFIGLVREKNGSSPAASMPETMKTKSHRQFPKPLYFGETDFGVTPILQAVMNLQPTQMLALG
jgi:hypothetical protein